MDPQKLDGALLGELAAATEAATYSVFVRTKPQLPLSSRVQLKSLGATEDASRSVVFTLDLDRRQIEALSAEPWVLSIRLSRKLRPLD